MPMFRVKICGITRVGDVRAAVEAGADALGLNFFPRSPRFVAPEKAAEIVAAIGRRAVKVGVFVNADARRVCETFDRLGLDLIQLHGDEPPEMLAELGSRPIVRAMRLGREGLRPVEEYLARCRRLGVVPQAMLVDALVEGLYGGSGKTADWAALGRCATDGTLPPLVLAGGLTAENVAEAIRAVRPAAVDTASGVESSPGRKDPARVAAFVRAAREAFEAIRGKTEPRMNTDEHG